MAKTKPASYLKTVTIDTFKKFVNYVESLRADKWGRCWYRGTGLSRYKLEPSLYRHKTKRTIEECLAVETQLFRRFSQRSIPFHNRHFDSMWDMLFFMQHYGMPTRLLDWSENPFFALFFAGTRAAGEQQNDGSYTYEADACIWVLRPEMWNKAAVSLKSYDGAILTPDDSLTKAHQPGVDCGVMAQYPVAMYGAHNSQRIVAQRGVFVVFGKSIDAMELQYRQLPFPRRALEKLVIPRRCIPDLVDAITLHGITDSVVFPELEGLARELKREFLFPVGHV